MFVWGVRLLPHFLHLLTSAFSGVSLDSGTQSPRKKEPGGQLSQGGRVAWAILRDVDDEPGSGGAHL